MRLFIIAFALGLLFSGNTYADKPMRFMAQLEGFNANGQAIPTTATGQAKVEVIDDGTALAFRVNVEGINNLLMAHIHVANNPVALHDPAGPIALWFTGGPPPGTVLTETVNGRLAQGFVVTDGQLRSWDVSDPADGTVAGLIEAIKQGRASVIVHTDDLDDTTPTGTAGDSRAGELRGTLQ